VIRRVLVLGAALVALVVAAPATAGLPSGLAGLPREPCPDGSEFTCVTVTVPLDHFDPANTQTIDVVFAILPATGRAKGAFVTATGGPGSSGIAVADGYTSLFAPSIRERFDIVFFDQRGIGLSQGQDCPEASAVYYQTDAPAATPDRQAALAASARAFAETCVAELSSPELLPYVGTDQAVEDLERFRQLLGEKLWLYGESYGTQYAQAYAAAHGDQLGGLLLDGTVDLTLTAPQYFREQAGAFEHALLATTSDCDRRPRCRADAGADALAAYDRLAAKLARAPMAIRFPLPSGGRATRELTLSDLETVAASAVYGQFGRLLLQRGIAYASRGQPTYLLRLLYFFLGADPETLEVEPDPSFSDAMYYGVECRDYSYYSGTPEEQAAQWFAEGAAVESAVPRMGFIFYGDLPCLYWKDAAQDVSRPAPLRAEGVTTIVLGADTDPATPYGNGVAVYRRLADGYLITQEGGPHVIFGRGRACPDEIVTAFLVDGVPPADRETVCPGAVADPYVPIAPPSALGYRTPRAALASAEREIAYLPEYNAWSGSGTGAAGCTTGRRGRITFRFVSDTRVAFRLRRCGFTPGLTLTGTGSYDYGDDRFELDVTLRGRFRGEYRYVRDGRRTSVRPERQRFVRPALPR
jgi:pimeloyl-ACP methyl ester carboxylesterase